MHGVATGRIAARDAGIDAGALIATAVEVDCIQLIPALIAQGVPVSSKSSKVH